MAVMVMLNNWFHDFSVALLVACLLVIWAMNRPALGIPLAAQRRLYRSLSRVALGCWIVLAVAGAVRTWAYRDYEWQPAAGRGQVAALAVKHVVLVALVVVGVIGQFRVRRRLKP